MRLTFVTVAHEIDFALMRLQARSMARYCRRDQIDRILVVENFTPGIEPNWRADLLCAYGCLAPLVEFHRSYDITPLTPNIGGWWTQQVLKLMIARVVKSERYVVLDAKNHFVAPLEASFLVSPNRLPTTRRYGYEAHPLRDALERTLQYLDVDPAPQVGLFMPTSTPFTIYRQIALDLIDYVERREGKPFQEAFLAERLTEFFLYSGYILKRGWRFEDLYNFNQPESPVVWDYKDAGALGLLKAIGLAELNGLPVFSLHRRAIADLDSIGREIVAQFWVRRRLQPSVQSGINFLTHEVQA